MDTGRHGSPPVSRGRRRAALLLLVFAIIVNLPLANRTWNDVRLDRSGTDVTVTVTGHHTTGSALWISFAFPKEIDPDRQTREARVEQRAYDDAVVTGRIGTRVLPGDPSTYRVDGAAGESGLVVATVAADVVVVLVFLLLWRFRGRRRATLRAVALEDVEPGTPEVLLERERAEDYLIRGEVLEAAADRVVLDLGNRTVEVLLDGHVNPVGPRQAAQVRARMIG
jgi:hypothetical protein